MKNHGFTKQDRLCSKGDFLRVFKDSKKIFCHGFVVHARKCSESSSKLGICVSKKLYKKAVDRNRIKRLLRESFRLGGGKAVRGTEVVVRASSPRLKDADIKKLWITVGKKCANW